MSIIKSILDTDYYKISIMQAIYSTPELYNRIVEYGFINRRKEGKFTQKFANKLRKEIDSFINIRLQKEEKEFLKKQNIFTDGFLDFLEAYRFQPDQVDLKVVDGELELKISGTWVSTILWEVPLMALISELYFQEIDTNWNYDGQEEKIIQKACVLSDLKGSFFSEFGTRRRRSFKTQDIVVKNIKEHADNCIGTSNVYFAMKYDMKPIGTVAHEWYMGIAAIKGFENANYYGLKYWSDVYKGKLGIALTDTFTTDAFLKSFDEYWARLYDGLRQDSGKPIDWFEKVSNHYVNLNLPTKHHKTLIFSDSLNLVVAKEIYDFVFDFNNDRISFTPCFGIGTYLTNDFENSPALNMVIKITSCDGKPTVKISDIITKSSGDPETVKTALKIFGVNNA